MSSHSCVSVYARVIEFVLLRLIIKRHGAHLSTGGNIENAPSLFAVMINATWEREECLWIKVGFLFNKEFGGFFSVDKVEANREKNTKCLASYFAAIGKCFPSRMSRTPQRDVYLWGYIYKGILFFFNFKRSYLLYTTYNNSFNIELGSYCRIIIEKFHPISGFIKLYII